MKKKEEKKGFWASLFAPKACSCGSWIVEEERPEVRSNTCCTAQEIVGGETKGGARTENAGETVRDVKVLGTGCQACKTTYAMIERIVNANHLDIRLTKVEDIAEIMRYNVLSIPAVVIDGVVQMSGRVPTEAEVKRLLGI